MLMKNKQYPLDTIMESFWKLIWEMKLVQNAVCYGIDSKASTTMRLHAFLYLLENTWKPPENLTKKQEEPEAVN